MIMKHDSLEQFIREHRTEFDAEHPPLHIWAGIERQLGTEKKPESAGHAARVFSISRFKMAAGIAALLVVGFMAGLGLAGRQQSSVMAEIEQVNPDFREAEKYYNEQIDSKIAQLASYKTEAAPVLEDLAQVDEIMQELRQELASAPAGAEEQIVSDLIVSYRTKLAILEKVLESISNKDAYQKSKTQQNETGI